MNAFERNVQLFDLTVSIILFVVGCIIGKLVMNMYDSWISFNGSAIGIVAVGELIWLRTRKVIIKKQEKETWETDRV